MPAYLAHGWLPAVLPAEATRVRVSDACLSYTLEAGGARLVDRNPDVEIGSTEEMRFDAPVAIACVDSRIHDSRGRLRQIVGRVAAHAEVRVRALKAAATLKRRGFNSIRVVRWDRDQAIRIPGLRHAGLSRLAERFPRDVLVVGGRGRPGPTVLERALADAAHRTGLRLRIARPIVSSGTLVVLLDEHVLRVAIGPASELIERQANVLVALHGSRSAGGVASLVPELLATGTAGLAEWSFERRVPGVHPPPVMSRPLFDASLGFLVDLFPLGQPGTGAFLAPRVNRLDAAARGALPAGVFDVLCDLAEEVDEELAPVPRAFYHGDFSTQNLLVFGDRLVGVIDWAQGDVSGLPMLDALNLQLLDATHPDIYGWGPAVSDYLLPLAQAGGSDATRRYARAVGLDLSARQLECLVRAYWLDRVSHQLATYVDRARDAAWIERNVTAVLPAASRRVRR